MSLEFVANTNMTIVVKPPATGIVTVTSLPSTKVLADGSFVYRGDLLFSVSNIVSAPCGTATPGTLPVGTISPTASKTKADSLFVIRVGDNVTSLQSVGAMEPNSPSPTPCVITFDVEIVDAGQTKVKAE